MDHKPECEWCNKPMRLWVYGQDFAAVNAAMNFISLSGERRWNFFAHSG